jgi:hypothetical protein
MSVTTLRIAGAILFFVLIFGSGFWLMKVGKPYNGALLNAHKLISIAAVILFGLTVLQIRKTTGLTSVELAATIVTAIFLLAAVISGGLSSIKTMPLILLVVHRVTLSLGTIATGITLYLLLR